MKAAIAAILLTALCATTPAHAQNAQGCILDHCEDREPPRAAPAPDTPPPSAPAPAPANATPRQTDAGPAPVGDGRTAALGGDFDYYILALSWSPGFCASQAGERARQQCAPGARLGFVVHGLWPQYADGRRFECDGDQSFVPRAALQAAHGLYPDDGLARHEWRVHGACSGLSAEDYFANVRLARDKVVVPPAFTNVSEDESVEPGEILRAFRAANPQLRPEAAGVACGGGALREVRLCLTKDLTQFHACPQGVRYACHARGGVDVAPIR